MPPVTTYLIEGKTTVTNGKGDEEYCVEIENPGVNKSNFYMDFNKTCDNIPEEIEKELTNYTNCKSNYNNETNN